MAIILLPVCFTAIFLSFCIYNTGTGKRELLLQTVLVFSLILAIITELLGCFQVLNSLSIAICWAVITIANLVYLFNKKSELSGVITSIKGRIAFTYRSLSSFERFLVIALAILLLFTFAQGIIYPPNNRDSLTYHMARIPSWISHQSVGPFPTHIIRQLYQPPFAEYVILHLNLLSHSDYFSASVQLFFLLSGLIAITSIVKYFGLGRSYQVTGLVLGATIPEVILQASSTQNDIVVAFFVLSSLYFCLKSITYPGIRNYLFLGLSAGLCVFTKGTAYLYLPPILLLFGVSVLIRTFAVKKVKYLVYAILLVAVLPLAINIPQYYRNYTVSRSLLGIDKNESRLYANERMDPTLFMCNALKNADLHLGLLFVPRITYISGKIIHKIFKTVNVDINDPSITYPDVTGIPGDSNYYNGMLVASHEDYGGNFIHLLLATFSFILIAWYFFKNKKNRLVGFLALIVIVQVIIFCAYLKWQPLGSRLQTSMFLLSVPLMCYASSLNKLLGKAVFKFAAPFILLYAFTIMLFNYARPYITYYQKPIHAFSLTAPTAITLDRFKKMFALNYNYKSCREYRDITIDIKKSHYKNIGLILGYNDWEYPLFSDCYNRELNPVHIFVTNFTKNVKGYPDDVDCIVSTTTNKPFIDYKGKRFFNQDVGNTLIYYYK